jgi:hypothetical protein
LCSRHGTVNSIDSATFESIVASLFSRHIFEPDKIQTRALKSASYLKQPFIREAATRYVRHDYFVAVIRARRRRRRRRKLAAIHCKVSRSMLAIREFAATIPYVLRD